MPKKKTREEVIEDFVSVHGEFYDYSRVDYVNNRTKVTIVCPDHGPFEQTPNNHKSGMGCRKCGISRQPQCQPKMNLSLVDEFTEIHQYKYNYDDMVYHGYNTHITVICPDHGSFSIMPYNHKAGHGCPECYQERKITISEDMTTPPDEWISRFGEVHGERYHYDIDTFGNAHTKVRMICDVHGEFYQSPNTHIRGRGCPECGKRSQIEKQQMTHADVIDRFISTHGITYDYSQVDYRGALNNVTIICPIHGPFEQTPAKHWNGANCPSCAISSVSKGEVEVAEYLSSLGVVVEQNRRDLIPPHEIDIYVPEYNLAIEYCGLYWHSDRHKDDPRYHINKYQKCIDRGITLITLFEDEWSERTDIVKSVLRNRIGFSDKGVGARKLTICEIEASTAKSFLELHHIQGYVPSTVKVAAYDGDTIVGVMLFGSPTRQNSASWELKRFVTDGKSYPGMASRLFNYFVKHYEPNDVLSFSDSRWFSGGLYETLGFTFDKHLNIDYTYVKGDKRFHKSGFRKERIKARLPDCYNANLTEREMMTNAGYSRIWDCGKKRWSWINGT